MSALPAAADGTALAPDRRAVLRVDDLTIGLPPGAERACAAEHVSFSIGPGETVCVVGESGSGKSLVALSLIGLLPRGVSVQGGRAVLQRSPAPAPGGSVRPASAPAIGASRAVDLLALSPAELRAVRGASIGMVFQEPMTALNPVMRVGDQLDEALRAHTALSARARRARVLAMLERVRLADAARVADSHPHRLSGGQRQRVVIAMALLLEPALLIVDEPTTALDVTTQAEVLALLAQMARELRTAVLFITHDMGVVAEIADRVLVLEHGAQREYGTRAQVLEAPRADYTRVLLDSVPGLAPPPAREPRTGPVRLRAVGLAKTFHERRLFGATRRTPALQDFGLALREGETVGIVGESGSGKTTAARCLVRLQDVDAGEIDWDGQPVAHLAGARLRARRALVQMVFQDPYRSLDPRWPVGRAIVEGALNAGVPREAAWARARELVERVRLPGAVLQRYPHQLSGGQRQRVAIARALATGPKVLVADEAVSALDVSVQAQIVALLRELQADMALAMLFITHDLRVAAQLCDRVLVMHAGRVVEEGSAQQVFGAPAHPYTKRLLAAAPRWERPSRPPG